MPALGYRGKKKGDKMRIENIEFYSKRVYGKRQQNN